MNFPLCFPTHEICYPVEMNLFLIPGCFTVMSEYLLMISPAIIS